MARGLLYQEGYKPQLSGHETFALRYGWLKKAHDAVKQAGGRDIFKGGDAIGELGLGKNMVASMRHWAITAGIVKENATQEEQPLQITPFGNFIFGEKGVDPYTENPATSWLLHWQLCNIGKKTTWSYAFFHFPRVTDQFDRETLTEGIIHMARDMGWLKTSENTIRRDVSCFLRTYAVSPYHGESLENHLESPLSELGLIRPTGRRDGFRFNRGDKPSLTPGIFGFALTEFWEKHHSETNTLSLEAITWEPESPGRAFLLDENDVAEQLVGLDTLSNGRYRWSETAGLKQVLRNQPLTLKEKSKLLKQAYKHPRLKEA